MIDYSVAGENLSGDNFDFCLLINIQNCSIHSNKLFCIHITSDVNKLLDSFLTNEIYYVQNILSI